MIIVVVVVFSFVGGAVTDVGGGEMRRESELRRERERKKGERAGEKRGREHIVFEAMVRSNWILPVDEI